MVEVGLAFVCALVAWSATAALVALYARNPRHTLLLWILSAASGAIALSVAFIGALLGFSALTFRIYQIGITLLAPLVATWAVVEFAARSARVRFGARLVAATLTIVPLVILSMDRLGDQFDSGLPPLAEHYDVIPTVVLGVVHSVLVLTLLGCAIAVLRRGGEREFSAGQQVMVIGLIGLAVVLELVVSRFGLGAFGQLLAAGAIVSLWVGCFKAQSDPGHWDDEDEFDDDPLEMEDDVPRRRRAPADGYENHDTGPAPQRTPQLRGIITIYTIIDGHQGVFDTLAEDMVAEVTRREPDTLLFAWHTVSGAPLQRIIYAVYRDQLAFEEHQQQPHIAEFSRKIQGRVAATNVIELSLAGASASDNLAPMLMPR